jgi:hypothetical protein
LSYDAKLKDKKVRQRRGARARKNNKSRAFAEREKESWLLATSLKKILYLSKKFVTIYATSIQIEENFRDLKIRLKMNRCGSRNIPRLQALLLTALVA